MRCPSCSASIPDAARFCPRCGQAFDADAVGKPEWNRMKSSVPATGWAFIAFVVVALVLLLLGALVGVKALLLIGVATVALLVLLLLLGAVC